MIRRATCDDIPAILALGREFHTLLGNLPEIDPHGSRMLLARAVYDKRQIVLVSVRGGVVRGFFWGHVDEYVFSKTKQAQDIIFYANDGSSSFLVRRFVKWAFEMGVLPRDIGLGVSNAIDPVAMDALMERVEFKRTGGYYRYRGV